MKRRVKLFINDRPATLSDESLILYNFSQTELSNPTIVKNSFSHTIDLPGDARNNAIFGDFFRLDRQSTEGNFNAIQRVPFTLYNEMSEVVERGYLKLNSVKRRGSLVASYNVSLYGGIGDFFYSLMYNEDGGQKTLADIVYPLGSSTLNPRLAAFVFNRNLVYNHWQKAATTDNDITDILQFVPAYEGLPSDFSANRAITYARSGGTTLANIKAETWRGEGDNRMHYMPHPDAQGAILLELAEPHTEWEVGDLRSYLQRPAISMKKILDALTLAVNGNGYHFVLDPRVFNDDCAYYMKTWLTLPLVPREYDNASIHFSDLLKGTASPARYLIDFAKMFGFVFDVDSAMKTITLTSRDLFYRDNASNVIDLTKRVSTGDECTINPFLASTKYYLFESPANSALAKAYKATYGREYGSQMVNTGYSFDAAPETLTKDSIFKGAVDALEASPYYFDNALSYTRMFSPNALTFKFGKYEDVHYKLWNNQVGESGNEELTSADCSAVAWTELDDSGHTLLNFWDPADPGKDFMPKVQLHSEENKAEDGSNVLLFLNGIAEIPTIGEGASSFKPNIYLSDDTPAMDVLNGGTPCWLAFGLQTTWETSYITRLTALPSFRRVYAPTGTYALSLDYGDAREIFTKDIFVEGMNIYAKVWENYIADRFDADAKVLSCMVNLRGLQVTPALLKRFFWYENSIWVLSKITNHSVTTDDLTECEFVKVGSTRSYAYGQNFQAGATPVYELEVSPDTVTFTPAAGQKTVTITSNYGWTIQGAPDWLTLSRTSGNGTANVVLSVGAYSSETSRYAMLRVVGDDGRSRSISVTQKVADASLTINGYTGRYPASSSAPIAYDNPQSTVTVVSNRAFTIVDPSNALVEGSQLSYAAGTHRITFNFKQNTGREDVQSLIHFKVGYQYIATFFVLRKAHVIGYSYALALLEDTFTIPARGGGVVAEIDGIIYEDGAESSRVIIGGDDVAVERIDGNADVEYAGDLNFGAPSLGTVVTPETSARYRVTWIEHPEATAIVTFIRAENKEMLPMVSNPIYDFRYILGGWRNSDTAVASASGDTAAIDVSQSTFTRTVTVSYSSGSRSTRTETVAWLPALSAVGTGLSLQGIGAALNINWDANNTTSVREGTIEARNPSGDLVGSVPLTQGVAASEITYALEVSPESLVFSAEGGEESIEVIGKRYVNGVLDAQMVLDASVLSIDKQDGDAGNQVSINGLDIIGSNLGVALLPVMNTSFIISWNGASATLPVSQAENKVESTTKVEVMRSIVDFYVGDFIISGGRVASAEGDMARFTVVGQITSDNVSTYSSGGESRTTETEDWYPVVGGLNPDIVSSEDFVLLVYDQPGGEHAMSIVENEGYDSRSADIKVMHNGEVLHQQTISQAGSSVGQYIVVEIRDAEGNPAVGADFYYYERLHPVHWVSDENGIVRIPNSEIDASTARNSPRIAFVGYPLYMMQQPLSQLMSKHTIVTLTL